MKLLRDLVLVCLAFSLATSIPGKCFLFNDTKVPDTCLPNEIFLGSQSTVNEGGFSKPTGTGMLVHGPPPESFVDFSPGDIAEPGYELVFLVKLMEVSLNEEDDMPVPPIENASSLPVSLEHHEDALKSALMLSFSFLIGFLAVTLLALPEFVAIAVYESLSGDEEEEVDEPGKELVDEELKDEEAKRRSKYIVKTQERLARKTTKKFVGPTLFKKKRWVKLVQGGRVIHKRQKEGESEAVEKKEEANKSELLEKAKLLDIHQRIRAGVRRMREQLRHKDSEPEPALESNI